MKLYTPADYASTSVTELLRAATAGMIEFDHALLHRLLDEPEATMPEIVRYAGSLTHEPADISLDLMRVFNVHPTSDAVPFLIDELRRFPDEMADEACTALRRIGQPAIEAMIEAQPEIDKAGGDLLWELACMGVDDERIAQRLEEAGDEGLAEVYREHLAGRGEELEAYDIWADYPESAIPDISELDGKTRLAFLASEYAPHRVAALESWLHEEHHAGLRAKIVALAKNDADLAVRCVAWECLREDSFEKDVRPAMLERLKSADTPPAERASLAIASSYFHFDEPAVGEAIRQSYEVPELRAVAIEAMWRTQDTGFRTFIAKHLDDSETDPEVKREAISAAGMLLMSDQLPRLRELIEGDEFRDIALHAYVMAAPGETSKHAMEKLVEQIDKIAHGLTEDEMEIVESAVELRTALAAPAEEHDHHHCDDPTHHHGPPVQPVTVNKVGRNDPCPCGSGKKFKKCCGAAA